MSGEVSKNKTKQNKRRKKDKKEKEKETRETKNGKAKSDGNSCIATRALLIHRIPLFSKNDLLLRSPNAYVSQYWMGRDGDDAQCRGKERKKEKKKKKEKKRKKCFPADATDAPDARPLSPFL